MNSRSPRSFTPNQKRAIAASEREVLLVAPPGSGKTEVLIQRVIRALEDSAGQAFRLLAVTFTVKAAEELRHRAQESIADELWRLDADTIHGFALDWLRRYGREIGVPPDVVVYSDDIDRMAVVTEYLQSIGLGNGSDRDGGSSMKSLLEAIDAYRTRGSANSPFERDHCYHGIALEELAEAYSAALESRGAIDFPGMLLSFRELLGEDEWVLWHFRTLYREILVDEGQDLTAIQADLLRQLAGDRIRLFVVADDKQSIRGYAGGSFAHARALVPEAALSPLHLRHNFRCAERILRAAEAVLHPVPDESRRPMAVEHPPPGRVRLVQVPSQAAEAAEIVSWICDLLKSGLDSDIVAKGEDTSVFPEDIGVFGRTRWTLDPVIEALSTAGIGYAVHTDSEVFLPEPEARLFIDCLAYCVNEKDSPAARRAVEEIQDLTRIELPADPLEALGCVDNDALRSLGLLVTDCLRGDPYFEQAMANLLSTGEAHGWPEGARTLSEAWQGYRVTTALQDRSPSGFLSHVTKMQRTRPTDPGVRLLTIDRAKGLEFRAVAVIGARDGLIPHYRTGSGPKRNEERRRLYVAMTRAARELTIAWPESTVDKYGRTHRQLPSPFLVEAGLLGVGVPAS